MSSSFGGGQGQIRYTIAIDDSQAVQKLQSIGQQFNTLGNATQQTQQQMQQMPNTLNEVSVESDKVAQSTDKTTQAFEQQGQKARQATTEQQSFGQVMKNNVTNLIQIGTGILGLVSNYTSLQRAQLSINKLQVTEANQVRLLDVLTRKHAEAVAKYGANSQEALDIENKINILQQKHTNTVDQLSIRQEQLTQSQIGFGISIISTGAGLVQAATGLKTYKAGADAAKVATIGLTQSINRLKVATVIGAVLVAIEIAAQAVANNFMGLRDWFDQVYNSLVKMAPAFKPVIDALFTIGEITTAIFTGDFDKIGKILGGQTAEGATTAAGALDDMGESTAEAGKELEKLRETVEEFQKTGTQLLVEASQGNRSEQRDLLKSLGIKGDEKKKMRDILDAVEDATTETQQAASKLEALEGFSILEKLGFEIDPDIIEDIQNTLDSDLRDVISGDNDPFNKLAEILEESPNKEKYGETLSKWATENPGLLEALRKFDPRLAAAIDSYIATFQINAQTKLDQTKLTFDPGVTFEANSKTLQGLHKSGDGGSAGGGLLDKIFKDFTPANVKKKLGEIMGAISDAITDPEFWHAIGATALSSLFAVSDALNKYVGPWLTMIAETLTDPVFWQAIGITAIQTFFAIHTAFNKYVMPWLAEIGKTLGDINFWKALGETVLGLLIQGLSVLAPVTEFLANIGKTITDKDFWFDVGKRIVGSIVKGITQDSLISKALQGQFFIPMTESPKDTSNASNSKTLMSKHKGKGNPWWDPFGIFSQQAFGAESTGDVPHQPGWTDGSGGGLWQAGVNPHMIRNIANSNTLQSLHKDKKDKKSTFGFEDMVSAAKFAQQAITHTFNELAATIQTLFQTLGKNWSSAMNTMGKNAKSGANQITDAMNTMLATLQELFKTMGKDWSKAMNTMGKNAKSGEAQVVDAMNNMTATSMELFQTLADNFSERMADMANNAKDAAQAINNELGKIKDVNVNVRIGLSGSGASIVEHFL